MQTAHLVLYFIFRKAHDITSELLLGTLGFVNLLFMLTSLLPIALDTVMKKKVQKKLL